MNILKILIFFSHLNVYKKSYQHKNVYFFKLFKSIVKVIHIIYQLIHLNVLTKQHLNASIF